ncbi:MAG: gliding motility-associated C-terminal domain-containing protein [Bacteroidota bacterium]
MSVRRFVLFVLCLLLLPTSFLFGQLETPDTHNEDACIQYVSTAFSPNGDGINDSFEIKIDCAITEYVLRILDHKGQEIHVSPTTSNRWDGRVNGRPAREGRYVWELEYRNPKGRVVRQQGEVILVR